MVPPKRKGRPGITPDGPFVRLPANRFRRGRRQSFFSQTTKRARARRRRSTPPRSCPRPETYPATSAYRFRRQSRATTRPPLWSRELRERSCRHLFAFAIVSFVAPSARAASSAARSDENAARCCRAFIQNHVEGLSSHRDHGACSNVTPLDARRACSPVNACQRCTATST
jgi:hypothetical protein